MSDHEMRPTDGLPADKHLRDDVAPAVEDDEAPGQDGFVPGQTNAGQQVGGLASSTGYGTEQDPDSQGDANHPV
jgi:hypothetical protein